MKIQERINRNLETAHNTRALLSKKAGLFVGSLDNPPKSLYIENYATCLVNRMIDIYDDSIFLLNNERIASACIISRGMIETCATGEFFIEEIVKVLKNFNGTKSCEAAAQKAIEFANSSRYKVTDQKRLKEGSLSLDDYSFTDEAIARMMSMNGKSIHVMNALRSLFEREKAESQNKLSIIEDFYDGLSEWVHPSQTSIYHAYTPDMQNTQTSEEIISIFDGAKYAISFAIKMIIGASSFMENIGHITREMNSRESASAPKV